MSWWHWKNPKYTEIKQVPQTKNNNKKKKNPNLVDHDNDVNDSRATTTQYGYPLFSCAFVLTSAILFQNPTLL